MSSIRWSHYPEYFFSLAQPIQNSKDKGCHRDMKISKTSYQYHRGRIMTLACKSEKVIMNHEGLPNKRQSYFPFEISRNWSPFSISDSSRLNYTQKKESLQHVKLRSKENLEYCIILSYGSSHSLTVLQTVSKKKQIVENGDGERDICRMESSESDCGVNNGDLFFLKPPIHQGKKRVKSIVCLLDLK